MKAEDEGLDLLEVSSKPEVPVCKIADYGKYRYDLDKKEQKSKKRRSQGDVKGVRLSLKIGRHDFETKARRARQFLEKGHKVSLQLRFKGREAVHADLGKKVLTDFVAELGEVSVDQEPKRLGRNMTMIVSPNKKGQDKKNAEDKTKDS